MPITPLHLGILAPAQRLCPHKISVQSFILANVMTDLPVLLYLYGARIEAMGGPAVSGTMHSTITHTFLGALLLGLVLSLFNFKSKAWWTGCLFGSLSHVVLDMFVHSDVTPFAPLTQRNPFYFEAAHAWLSIVLMIGVVYFLLTVNDKRKASRQSVTKY